MELTTLRLVLKEITTSDLEDIHELHSLPETDQFNTLGIPENREVTKQLIAEWITTQTKLPREKYVFRIATNQKEFVGLVGINMGQPKYRKAEIWFKLHPTQWNKGFATEVVKGILHFGFTSLNLHRIEAGCAVTNLASKRVLEKAGMIQEGRCRKNLPIRGEWIDNFEFAILETDFAHTHV